MSENTATLEYAGNEVAVFSLVLSEISFVWIRFYSRKFRVSFQHFSCDFTTEISNSEWSVLKKYNAAFNKERNFITLERLLSAECRLFHR